MPWSQTNCTCKLQLTKMIHNMSTRKTMNWLQTRWVKTSMLTVQIKRWCVKSPDKVLNCDTGQKYYVDSENSSCSG